MVELSGNGPYCSLWYRYHRNTHSRMKCPAGSGFHSWFGSGSGLAMAPISGSWFLVSGFWFLVSGFWFAFRSAPALLVGGRCQGVPGGRGEGMLEQALPEYPAVSATQEGQEGWGRSSGSRTRASGRAGDVACSRGHAHLHDWGSQLGHPMGSCLAPQAGKQLYVGCRVSLRAVWQDPCVGGWVASCGESQPIPTGTHPHRMHLCDVCCILFLVVFRFLCSCLRQLCLRLASIC